MDRRHLNIIICALITTIAEFTDEFGAPEGVLYAGLMDRVDHATFQEIIDLLISAGMIERQAGPVLVVTDKGRALADKANAAIKTQ